MPAFTGTAGTEACATFSRPAPTTIVAGMDSVDFVDGVDAAHCSEERAESLLSVPSFLIST